MTVKEKLVDEYDAHDVHIDEHMRKLLSEAVLDSKDDEYINRLKKHVDEHKSLALIEQLANAFKAEMQNE